MGATAVTFATTAVAPLGTTTAGPEGVSTVPVICTMSGCIEPSGPSRPSSTLLSTRRTGVTATKLTAGLGAADATNSPDAPIDTATAAPTAAHHERTNTSPEPCVNFMPDAS